LSDGLEDLEDVIDDHSSSDGEEEEKTAELAEQAEAALVPETSHNVSHAKEARNLLIHAPFTLRATLLWTCCHPFQLTLQCLGS